MPKHFKRVAARQAALSRRRARSRSRPALLHAKPATASADGGAAESAPELLASREGASELSVPPRPTPRPASARRGLPALPYLRGDLRRIGVFTGALLAVLVILALFL